MSDLHSFSFFDTILYKAELPEYLKDKNFMDVCDEHTDQAISNTKKLIDERNKKFKTDVKDHGMSYHSGAEMYKDERFNNFELLIRNTAKNILENQIIGARETHRIVIEVIPQKAPMGKVIKDHGGIIL